MIVIMLGNRFERREIVLGRSQCFVQKQQGPVDLSRALANASSANDRDFKVQAVSHSLGS
jgi:hypothetical protein